MAGMKLVHSKICGFWWTQQVTITRAVNLSRKQKAFCTEKYDSQHLLSESYPYEKAQDSQPPVPNLPACQDSAWRSLSTLPQRPLFILAKTKPKVYSRTPKHPKHPDIYQRYHLRLLWDRYLVYPPFSHHHPCSLFSLCQALSCEVRTAYNTAHILDTRSSKECWIK